MSSHRPSVGLLFNASTPEVIAEVAPLVEHLAIIPSQFVYDFGANHPAAPRFVHPRPLLELVSPWLQGRTLTAHGFGMSLPTIRPLDREALSAIQLVGQALGGFAWMSEHLNLLAPPNCGEPHCDGAMALPLSYDEESLQVLLAKVKGFRDQLPTSLLLENPAIFTPLVEMEMNEPEFLNRLHREGGCGTLLDFHNLWVSARNGGMDVESYLSALDPLAVGEVHLAGGEEFNGFYTDSHSTLTPPEVWSMAYSFLPLCRHCRAITFEYNDTYFSEIGVDGVRAELERMHQLADHCHLAIPTPTPCLAPC